MKQIIRATLFFTWVAAMSLFLLWFGLKLDKMQRARAESINKLVQKLDETAKRAQEVCEQAIALCHQVGAQGCGECPK